MKQKFLAAAVQMVSGSDVTANLQRAAHWVAEAAAKGARLVVLPEYFCLMGKQETDKVAVCEAYGDGPIQRALARMANENGVWLAAGTVPLRSPEPQRVLNTTLLFDPNGEVRARYDKIHLFGFSGLGETYCESNTIRPGEQPVKADLALPRWPSVSATICVSPSCSASCRPMI